MLMLNVGGRDGNNTGSGFDGFSLLLNGNKRVRCFDDAIDDLKLWFQCLEAEHGN